MHRIWIILAEKPRGTVIESRQAPLQWSLEVITFANQVAFVRSLKTKFLVFNIHLRLRTLSACQSMIYILAGN